ncbi:MAG: nitroreductase family protein [Methanomassiliicoccales archaeon]|jgi:nitroreductase|nr:nitroreductase family protein [Methanomassiliicoccales archaeon]
MNLMQVHEAIKERRAKRALDTTPIEKNVLNELIDAIRFAPSCFNNQPWRIIIVSDKETLQEVKRTLSKGNAWATRSPLIFVVASRPEDDCRLSDRRDYHLFSCGLAIGQMLLMATELKLIAHPIAGYDPIEIKKILKIPEEYIVITLVICGYQGSDQSLLSPKQLEAELERPERKPISENFFSNTWGNPITP